MTERESAEVVVRRCLDPRYQVTGGDALDSLTTRLSELQAKLNSPYLEGKTLGELLDATAERDTYAAQAVSARLERDAFHAKYADALHRAGRLSEELRNSQAKVSRLEEALERIANERTSDGIPIHFSAAPIARAALDSEGVEAQAKVRAGKSGEGSPAAPTPDVDEALAVIASIQADLKEAREEMQAASATANIRTTVLLGRAERAEAKLGEPCPWCGGRRDEFPRLQQPEPTPPKETSE